MSRTGFVLAQLRARPVRTVLTALAFAFSVGLLGFLLVLNDAFQQDWSPNMARRAMLMAKSSFYERLPIAYLGKIEATPGVERVTPFDFVLAYWKDTRPENQVPLQAATADSFIDIYLEADIPEDQVKAWKEDPTGCIVGPVLYKKFGWKIGDRLVLKAPVKGGVVETTIRGLMKYKIDNGVYIHRRYFEAVTGDEGKAAMFWILARSREDVSRVTSALGKEFENAAVPARAMSEKQWQLMFMEMIGNVKLLFGSIGLATAFTLLLITSNSLAMSARERRSQTALLRVLGFQKSDVAGFLLGEAALYGVLGGLLGVGLIFLFSKLVGIALDQTQMAGIGGLLVPRREVVVFSVLLSGVLSVLAGVFPAIGLTRQSIVQLLRDRG